MSRKYLINNVPLDLDLAIKRLKHDMRDDWFKDALMFQDDLRIDEIRKRLDLYIKKLDRYRPCNSLEFNIPKKEFTLRYSIETNIQDRLIYQALADYLILYYDPLISPRVYSHRKSRAHEKKYLFAPSVDAWRSFIFEIRAKMDTSNKVLLVTDVQNFYENIQFQQLKRVLTGLLPEIKANNKRKQTIQEAIKFIIRLLKEWRLGREEGIPQNRDTSSFLGNIFLRPVDHEMIQKGYDYFRYMDDIRIICSDEFQARKALRDLIIELRERGLNVNSKKTKILEMNDRTFDEFVPEPNNKMEQIDALLKSKKVYNIRTAIPLLKKYTMELIRKNRTTDREFRFCIHRLTRVARNKTLKRIVNLRSITNRVIKELVAQPYAADSLVEFLKSVKLSPANLQNLKTFFCNSEKNIYEWEIYHIWILFLLQDFKDQELIAHARSIIEANTNLKPKLAGAILYLGCMGNLHDRNFISRKFSNFNDFFTQRAALIAIHELDYADYVKPLVENYVIDELKGTFSRLSKNFRGKYFVPIEPLSGEELFRDLPDHIS